MFGQNKFIGRQGDQCVWVIRNRGDFGIPGVLGDVIRVIYRKKWKFLPEGVWLPDLETQEYDFHVAGSVEFRGLGEFQESCRNFIEQKH